MGNCSSSDSKPAPARVDHHPPSRGKQGGDAQRSGKYRRPDNANRPPADNACTPTSPFLRENNVAPAVSLGPGIRRKKKEVDNASDNSDSDGWPWKWLLRSAPRPMDATAREYSDYLGSFHILTNTEADAYQLWLAGDEASARDLLDDRRRDEDAGSPVLSPMLSSGAGSPISFSSESEFDQRSRFSDIMNIHGDDESGRRGRHTEVLNEGGLDTKLSPHAHASRDSIDLGDYCDMPSQAKTEADVEMLIDALKGVAYFSHVVRDSELRQIAMAMQRVTYARGVTVHKKGVFPFGDLFGLTIVSSGRVNVDTVPKHRGEFFGQSLVSSVNERAKATSIAAADTEAYILDNTSFTSMLAMQARIKYAKYKEWLNGIPILGCLPPASIDHLASALREMKYAPGSKVIEFGKPCSDMHLIVDGVVDVVGREQKGGVLIPGQKRHVCSFTTGHPVGYIEFFEQEAGTNIADVVANTEVITAKISRDRFELVFGPIKDMLQGLTDAPEYEYYRSVKEKNASKS